MVTKKMLDLRYNKMWNNNNSESEDDGFSIPFFKRNLVLSWKNLNVSVTQTIHKTFGRNEIVYKQILSNISGYVECGTLLGIMGPSSGKTTLMATISHRTKGNFQGELLINGRPVSENIMIKLSGFVAQEDESFVQLTVLEQLQMMARLKLDRTATKKVIKERIDYLTNHLGLNKILHSRLSYLSGGERKKVALAIQLVNDPPILFCDEITTGLDSYSAAHIINTLRKVARSGKIVICTIHQPASGLFDQFQDVILLTNGRLAYQGTVSLVNNVFQMYDGKFEFGCCNSNDLFGFVCPATYNKADYILSVLNSNNVVDRKSVNNMCDLSSAISQIDSMFNIYDMDIPPEVAHHILQTEKVDWATQFRLLLFRSITCFIRNYKEKLLEFCILMFLAFIISSPYANLEFDTNAVQNWQGFWILLIMITVYHFTSTGMSIHQTKFSVVHREFSNSAYSLSAFYVSELIVFITWLMIKVVFYAILVFFIVGVDWNYMQLCAFSLVALASFSYGCLWSAYFSNIEEAVVYSTVYEYLSLPVSGAYISLSSLPKSVYNLRYLSLFFLGSETVSSIFWNGLQYLPCIDVDNCLNNGEEVLKNYGYKSENLYFDLNLLLSFSVFANVIGYFGVQRRMKKQPAY